MPRSSECPEPQQIARLLDGNVTTEERETLQRHLASCRSCYRLVTESEEVRSRLENDGDGSAPEGGARQ